MADIPVEISLREMLELMSSSSDDAVFRWFTIDKDKTVYVTMKQARKEIGLGLEERVRQATKAGIAGLIPQHPFYGEVACAWCGFIEDTIIEQERLHVKSVTT